jgi:hypothetical protein
LTYAPGTVLNGLQAVEDLALPANSGPQFSYTTTYAGDSGATLDAMPGVMVDNSGAQKFVYIDGAIAPTWTRTDFTGATVIFYSPSGVLVSDLAVSHCKFSNPNYAPLIISQVGGGWAATGGVWSYNLFDTISDPTVKRAATMVHDEIGTAQHFHHNRFENCAQCSLNLGGVSAGTYIVEDNVFPGAGRYAYVHPTDVLQNDHSEPFTCRGGALTFRRNLFDASDAPVPGSQTVTAQFFLQPNTANINAEIHSNVWKGFPTDGSYPNVATLVVDGFLTGGFDTVVTFTNNVVGSRDESDTAKFLSSTTNPAWGSDVTILGSGNVSLTGATSIASMNALTGVGATTLSLTVSGAGTAFGPVIGSGSTTLTLTASGAGSSVTGTGATTLTLAVGGTGSVTNSAAGTGSTTLTLTTVGAGSVGVAGSGATTLTLTVSGVGIVGGLSAPAVTGGTRPAPRRVGKTKTAAARTARTITAG